MTDEKDEHMKAELQSELDQMRANLEGNIELKMKELWTNGTTP